MQTPYVITPLQEKFLGSTALTAISLLLLVCLAACGGGQAIARQTTPTPHPAKMLTAKTSPCSLVTRSQVEQILKTSVTIKPPLTLPNGDVVQEEGCWYTGVKSDASAQLVLLTFPDTPSAEAAFRNLGASQSMQGAQSIGGLGEQAVLLPNPVPTLYVQKDNGLLSVGVASNASASAREEQEKQLAQLAVQQM